MVVSETLISGILAEVPRDSRVVSAVRQIIADHAEDEGHHSAFFSQYFAFLRRRLDRGLRDTLGPLVPRFILAFLEPDRAAIRRTLARFPLDPDEADAVVDEAYPAAGLTAGERAAATVTFHLFERNGVFDGPRLADAFRGHGLID